MKVYRELYIYLSNNITDEFFKDVENILCDGWKRNHDFENESAKEDRQIYYFFSCEKSATREAAIIAFIRKNENIVYIPNVIPLKSSELSIDQYNNIINEFYNNFLQPICKKRSIQIDITDENQSMSNWISDDTYNNLVRFSRAANKSTGSAHFFDQQRWFAFIVSVIRNDDALSSDKLVRWLVEEEKWPQDIASDLAIEYEQGISLLKYYIENYHDNQ